MAILFEMKPLVILKAGETFPQLARRFGDFDRWIERGLRTSRVPIRVVDPRAEEPLPSPTEVAGAVVTGSHAMVTDRRPWSEELAVWLQKLVLHRTPLLGICFGHQLLAYALGGEVAFHPGGLEIGTVEMQTAGAAAEDRLFASLPARFDAQVVHRQSVRSLPPDAVLLAGNSFEPNQAFRIGESAWGVQFHPEFSRDVMAAYVSHLAPELEAAGLSVPQLLDRLDHTEAAASVLQQFGALVEASLSPSA